MARREKKPVHKVVMTEGNEISFSNSFRSMISKLLKISRMLSKICSASFNVMKPAPELMVKHGGFTMPLTLYLHSLASIKSVAGLI